MGSAFKLSIDQLRRPIVGGVLAKHAHAKREIVKVWNSCCNICVASFVWHQLPTWNQTLMWKVQSVVSKQWHGESVDSPHYWFHILLASNFFTPADVPGSKGFWQMLRNHWLGWLLIVHAALDTGTHDGSGKWKSKTLTQDGSRDVKYVTETSSDA